ncbi:MAG: alpha/beta hydrolase [Dysgonamonadaceae bacterium]|nr:alpha/beta hydrolase [Dysgonamonadaceae bacterium]
MKKFVRFILLMFIALDASAQARMNNIKILPENIPAQGWEVAFNEIPLWPDGAPNTNGLPEEELRMENGRVGNVTHPVLYVYLPQTTAPTAAVIICPGGGYVRLAMDHEGHEVAQWLNSLGIAGIVLKYRMPNGHSDVPLSDAQQALRMVRQNSRQWNIAPGKIGIAGFSAGGHLASTAATHFTDSITRPDFAILFYPVISMDASISHPGSHQRLLGENPGEALLDKFSNEKQVTPQTPPTALFLSDDDRTVPPRNSSGFYDALKQNNVPAALYIFPTGGHGWGMRPEFKYHNQWKELLIQWLETMNMK